MKEQESPNPNIDPVRRKLLRATALLGGAFAAGRLPYEKPALKSFFGVRQAWAQGSGPATLTCSALVVPSPGPGLACQDSIVQNLMIQVSPIPPVGTVLRCTPTTDDPNNATLPNFSTTTAMTDAAGKVMFAQLDLTGNVPNPPLAIGSRVTLTADFVDKTTWGTAYCMSGFTIVDCRGGTT